jgi:predicted phage terminase large subunit-like protein
MLDLDTVPEDQLQNLASAINKRKAVVESAKSEDSLLAFAEYVWPVVEPAIPFIKGWVLEAIAEHLEAVTYGHIRRLLINVPPGFTKSLMTDVFWPAWEWGPQNMPHLRYVCASYSNHLTERDNMRCRNIIVSDRYRKLWGDRFGVANDQFTKIKFANDKTGWKLATSVGGIGVGERGDRFIIDDPNNTMEMESEVTRNTTNMWFTEVVPDRLNNQKTSAIVVIMQRLHEDDVSGTAISREMGYTHLMVPMEHDSKRHCVTVLGVDDDGDEVLWEDPREEEDQLVWPERFPPEIVTELKRDKGPYAYAGQYQQHPVPRGGAIIREDDWMDWDEAGARALGLEYEQNKFPAFEYVVASLDTAYTAKEENDASALSIWGLFRDQNENPKVMLVYCWEERLEFNKLVEKVILTCTQDRRPFGVPRFKIDRLLVEAKASGLSVAQEIHRLVSFSAPFGIELINPQKFGDKVARVHSIQHLFTEGLIYAPIKVFSDKMINQCSIFPRGSHDDLVDSMAQAMRYLRDCGFALKRDESAADRASLVEYKPKPQPLYPC